MKSEAWNGLTVKLRVNGNDLTEYDQGDQDGGEPNTSVCYVEAVPGANFSIELRAQQRFPYRSYYITSAVKLDGVAAQSTIYSPDYANEIMRRSEAGVYNGGPNSGTLERFTFAELKTTDEAAKPGMKEQLSSLGEITVELTRCKQLGYLPDENRHYGFHSATSSGVPEKALKGRAISTRTKLGVPERSSGVRRVDVQYPWGTVPFATFKFMYRSHKDLQIEGIIPRSPSPVPLDERDPNSLSAEEARELVRRMRAREEDTAQIKKEKRKAPTIIEDDGEEDDDVTIAEETRGRKRSRITRDSAVEVIDLSAD